MLLSEEKKIVNFLALVMRKLLGRLTFTCFSHTTVLSQGINQINVLCMYSMI